MWMFRWLSLLRRESKKIRDKKRGYCLENPDTGERCEVMDSAEFKAYCKRGWKWVLRSDGPLKQSKSW